METNETEPSEKLRGKTDKSLEDERIKTDEYLDKKSAIVTDDAEEVIRLNRIAADKAREASREIVDLQKTENRLNSTGSQSARLDDKSLVKERKRSDEAQNVERKKEDQVRSKERFQKRLIAEALLESERKETDTNLFDERVRLDIESEQNSNLLLDEKISHDLTKTALLTRDQFLAVVSHDLKNPLGSISMSASLMKSGLSETEIDVKSLRSYLEIIERNAANMDRMISDLLDVEQIANGKLSLSIERHDIRSLLQECMSLFAPVVANKAISMTIQASPEPVFADIDHDRVLQVLSNLIGNAVKFTPSGGAIELSAQQTATEIEITVTDTGLGIPEGKKSQIFERFSQLKTNDRRGIGLGLFISKWIVEAHKGRIWVTSELGKGSAFTFAFPISVAH